MKRNSILLLLTLACFFVGSATADTASQYWTLRKLSSHDRVEAFSKLAIDQKLDLFFYANRREPPGMPFEYAFSQEPVSTILALREAIRARTYVDIISFLNIVLEMRRQHTFSDENLRNADLIGICGGLTSMIDVCAERLDRIMRPHSSEKAN